MDCFTALSSGALVQASLQASNTSMNIQGPIQVSMKDFLHRAAASFLALLQKCTEYRGLLGPGLDRDG